MPESGRMKANTSRRSRFAFGLDPSAYERGRMPFSRSTVRWALNRTRFRPGDKVLEIGAGTGQLTRELLAAGANVTALEPSDTLADALQQSHKEGDAGELEVSRDTFEEFVAPNEFALVVAANSFHWIDPAVSYRKSADNLDEDGRLCLFWYFPILADAELQQRVNTVCRAHGLEDLVRDPIGYGESLQPLLSEGRVEAEESGYLRCLDWVLEPRRLTYPVGEYCDLLETYASVRDLTELRGSLLSSVFHDAPSVELDVYEYACVAKAIDRSVD